MLPTYQPGDRVLVWRWGNIREGDIVVFCRNGMTLVKRATRKVSPDRWIMRGDNWRESTDSIDFGEVPNQSIIGKIVSTY